MSHPATVSTVSFSHCSRSAQAAATPRRRKTVSLLEFVLRARVERLPTVRLQSPCRVRSILLAVDRSCATGVSFEEADGRSREQHADLVIDASGRGSLAIDNQRAAGHRRQVMAGTAAGERRLTGIIKFQVG